MNSETMIAFTQLFACEQTEIYEVGPTTNKFIVKTKLSVLIDSDNQLLLLMGPICYGVTKQTQISYTQIKQHQHDKQHQDQLQESNVVKIKMLNSLHGSYEVIVKENCDVLLACLGSKVQVKNVTAQTQSQKAFGKCETPKGNQLQKQLEKQEIKQIGLPQNEGDNAPVKISKAVGNGVYWTGKYISMGLLAVGGYIASKLEKSQHIVLGQNTKKGLQIMSDLSGKVFSLASGAAIGLINYGRDIAIKVASQPQVAEKFQEQRTLSILKDGALTGVKIFINIYDGLVQGTNEIKDGAIKGGQQIVKRRYGDEAQQAVINFSQSLNNVVKIYRIPKSSAQYLFLLQKQDNKFQQALCSSQKAKVQI